MGRGATGPGRLVGWLRGLCACPLSERLCSTAPPPVCPRTCTYTSIHAAQYAHIRLSPPPLLPARRTRPSACRRRWRRACPSCWSPTPTSTRPRLGVHRPSSAASRASSPRSGACRPTPLPLTNPLPLNEPHYLKLHCGPCCLCRPNPVFVGQLTRAFRCSFLIEWKSLSSSVTLPAAYTGVWLMLSSCLLRGITAAGKQSRLMAGTESQTDLGLSSSLVLQQQSSYRQPSAQLAGRSTDSVIRAVAGVPARAPHEQHEQPARQAGTSITAGQPCQPTCRGAASPLCRGPASTRAIHPTPGI